MHTEAIDKDGRETVCFLPTRLHEKYVEYLQTHNPKPFPSSEFPSVTTLYEAILRRFSRKSLLRTHEPSAFSKPEFKFHEEWYRVFNSLAGRGVAISSEWTFAGEGCVDFRIKEPGWGVEILQDGDRLDKHCKRFLPDGSYNGWVSEGILNDWLILDCRHTVPERYEIEGTNLWRVIFKEDYSSANVLNCDNEIIAPEFPLLD
ncbi:hypothetical protein SI65_09219 [Aspergillus cristatus]|uniref:Uncharacterized protein n=1 Tax=Aspergillus cristatus TaxID=573508 RepID=A0A1E3B302_ASPCR|nr:hypothetical protein SI65_09219 [Aspergillus cristatus]